MDQNSVLRDTALLGSSLVVLLCILGVFIALVLGESPVAFLTDLFTDPIWLFTVALSLYFIISGYRRAKAKLP